MSNDDSEEMPSPIAQSVKADSERQPKSIEKNKTLQEEERLYALDAPYHIVEKDIRGNYSIRKHLRVLLIVGMYLGGVAFAILCGRYIYGIWDNDDKVLSLLRETIGVTIGLVIGQRLPKIFPSTIFHRKPQQ